MSGSNLDANTYLKWITFKCKSTVEWVHTIIHAVVGIAFQVGLGAPGNVRRAERWRASDGIPRAPRAVHSLYGWSLLLLLWFGWLIDYLGIARGILNADYCVK